MSGALATLLRLRRLEVETARRALAEAISAETQAARALAAAEAALCEAAMAANTQALLPLQNFAAWLPRGTEARQAAARTVEAAEAATAMARQALAHRSGALRAAEILVEAEGRRVRQQERRQEGYRLDEVFRARRG